MSRDLNRKMGTSRQLPRALGLSPLLWLLGVGACTSVLGIEDLHDGPRPGSDLTGGDTGAGDTQSTGGKSGASNSGGTNDNPGGKSSGGTSGNAGALGNGAGSGNEPTGGANGNPGGAGAGNDAGAGGAGAPGSTVHGHVVDFWGHAVPNIAVQIGDALGGTDEKGDFVFDNVPGTYEVSMVYNHVDTAQSDAWVYQGLTRRDPTLQMYGGTTKRSEYIGISFVPKPTLVAGQTIWVSLGGPDGTSVNDALTADGTSDAYTVWYGPEMAQQTAHGLLWQKDAGGLPTNYLGYKSAPVSLVDSGSTSVVLNLSPTTIAKGNVQGTVTGNGAGPRSNQVYLRFTSNASIKLVDDNGPATFSYVVPTIANSGLTVAGVQGIQYGGFAVAHADKLAPGAKPTLKIPPPIVQLSPADGTTGVSSATKFTLQAPTGNPGPFVVAFYSQDQVKAYQTIYLVTTQKQFTFPEIIGGGFTTYPGGEYLWSVATHGAYASVDAMAAPGGFLDEFSRDEQTADGPRQTTGEFTDSPPRSVTFK